MKHLLKTLKWGAALCLGLAFTGQVNGQNAIFQNSFLLPGTSAGSTSNSGTNNCILGSSCSGATGGALTSGSANTLVGYGAAPSLTSGSNNLILGYQSGNSLTLGSGNCFMGYQAGYSQVGLVGNVFIGDSAGRSASNGWDNTFLGRNAGANSTCGSGTYETPGQNTFIGSGAGQNATYTGTGGSGDPVGMESVFVGYQAGMYAQLNDNTNGMNSIYIGHQAGKGTSSGTPNAGYYNTCIGFHSAIVNSTGYDNTFLGFVTGNLNTTGYSNTFIGSNNGDFNTTGHQNVFVGDHCGRGNSSASYNTYVGANSGSSNNNSNNTFVGQFCSNGSTGGNNTFVGMDCGVGTNSAGINTGTNDVLMGVECAHYLGEGSYNTILGSNAAYYIVNSDSNIIIGAYAGKTSGKYNTPKNANVIIGVNAGQKSATSTCTIIGAYADANDTSFVNASAFGYKAKVDSSYHMAFGNSNTNGYYFGRDNLEGGRALEVGVSGSTNGGNAAYLSAGGTWVNASDINLKTNITSVNGEDILNKIDELKISRWMYKGTHNEYHIGPMAQQFYSLFNLGLDNKGISTIDPAGVALIGIQELSKHNDDMQKKVDDMQQKLNDMATQNQNLIIQNQQLINQYTTLESRLAALESCTPCGQKQTNPSINDQNNGGSGIINILDAPSLEQNTPNPFSASTTIRYHLTKTISTAVINIRTTEGKQVATYPVNGDGNGQIIIQGGTLSAGNYIYDLEANGQKIDSKKMTIVAQ